ncbi:MAG: TonB-dependent receptor [candidate division WOR-3 bacterium]
MKRSVFISRWVGVVGLVFLFLFLSPQAQAGITGKIIGVVIDAEKGVPLIGAHVIIEGTSMGAASDENGFFFIMNVPPGIYSIQARMMGYESVTKTRIEVTADHTTQIKFELKPTVLPSEGITVRAEAEVIKMDISSSTISAKREEIEAVPLVTDISEYINLQSGVENWKVRGGGMDQTAFMVDGLMLVDNRSNSMLMTPNISTIKELNILKGGFNAEYGNVRSGVINIVTKEPSFEKYEGTFNFRYAPPQMKHRGPSVFNPKNVLLRPYLDTTTLPKSGKNVAFHGYKAWLEEYGQKAGQDTIYKYLRSKWEGWNTYGPAHGMTPQQAYEEFMWTHCVEGTSDLIPEDYHGHPRDRTYGDEPDWNVDGSFGGPLPIIGKHLGNLTFLASYRTDYQQFGLPVNQGQEFYHEWNASLKITSFLTKNMKLSLEGMKEVIYTLGAYATGEKAGGSVGILGGGSYGKGDPGGFFMSGKDVFNKESSEYVDGEWGLSTIYYPCAFSPAVIDKDMQGISIDHSLNQSTFYTLRFTRIISENKCNGVFGVDTNQSWFERLMDPGVEPLPKRDTLTKYTLPSGVEVTESPFGYTYKELKSADNAVMGGNGACAIDLSNVVTYNLKFDITSQLNKYNEIKAGFVFNYDDMYTYAEKNFPGYGGGERWVIEWDHQPIRGGAYIQDKLEFEGFIANIGLRMDYNNPNCKWPFKERFPQIFTAQLKDTLRSSNPPPEVMTPVQAQMQWSPRIGISHPISENAKLYFNYGHFYSMASSKDMYLMHFGKPGDPMAALGNPSASMPRTIAYELGADFNIIGMFWAHLAGYYKDVDRQTAWVRYESYYGDINYATVENTNYEDIRGFEFRFEKRFGNIKGWINYDYMVKTWGTVGREVYYEDPIKNQKEGLRDPIEAVSRPQPRMNAFIQFSSPKEWGIIFGSFDLSFLYEWKAGFWETWDPLRTGLPRFQYNLQWQPWRTLNAKLAKSISFASLNISIFAEVENLLDWRYLDPNGFKGGKDDKGDYLRSLKLKIYEDPVFEGKEEYEPGNDKVGDLCSEKKPYINDPNVTFLAFHDPRRISFGLKMDF